MLFHIYILILAFTLQCVGFQYIEINDLAVYADAIKSDGIYRGDYAFEQMQHALIFLVGSEYVISGLQFILILLAVIYIYLLRLKIRINIFFSAFIILTSPVVLVGLTNSIRQSIAFLLSIMIFESRGILLKVILCASAIMFHKVTLVLFPLLILMDVDKSGILNVKKMIFSLKIFPIIFLIGALIVFNYGAIYSLAMSVYNRYSEYLYDAVVFTDGRFGGIKLVVWLIFWSVLMILIKLASSKKPLSKYLFVPILYTIFIAFDAAFRGFDEFHSRMLMVNNVLLIFWYSIFIKNTQKNTTIINIFLLLCNLFNPSTIGVII